MHAETPTSFKHPATLHKCFDDVLVSTQQRSSAATQLKSNLFIRNSYLFYLKFKRSPFIFCFNNFRLHHLFWDLHAECSSSPVFFVVAFAHPQTQSFYCFLSVPFRLFALLFPPIKHLLHFRLSRAYTLTQHPLSLSFSRNWIVKAEMVETKIFFASFALFCRGGPFVGTSKDGWLEQSWRFHEFLSSTRFSFLPSKRSTGRDGRLRRL